MNKRKNRRERQYADGNRKNEEDEEENVIIARIEFDENGEEVYLAPTDEEFDEVKAAYEKLMEDWDEE